MSMSAKRGQTRVLRLHRLASTLSDRTGASTALRPAPSASDTILVAEGALVSLEGKEFV